MTGARGGAIISAVLLVALCRAGGAHPLDPELARGTTSATGGPAGMVAIALDADPVPELLAVLERYGVPATFFVSIDYWDKAHDAEELAQVRRAEAQIGLRMERGIDPAPALARAERAGFSIGTFHAARVLGGARSSGRRAGLTDVQWSLTVTSAAQARSLARGGAIVRIVPEALAATLDELERINCERLARKQRITVPVSLHYFVRDRGGPRPVPDHIQLRTDAFRHALVERCEDRAAKRAPGDYSGPRPRGDFDPCRENPLAKGCR